MLTKIKKSEGVNSSERRLIKKIYGSFLSLWSYPGLYTDEGITKNKQGKELCDLLIVFDNNVLIFSDKDIKFNETIDVDVAWNRWLRKSVLSSYSQLHAAERWIKDNPKRVFLDSRCKDPFPLKIDFPKVNIHLIALTNDPVQSDSVKKSLLKHRYNTNDDISIDGAYTLTDFVKQKSFVHIFDEVSFDLILEHVDTISDFIHYLDERRKCIRGDELVCSFMGEESLLAEYIQSIDDSLKGSLPAKNNPVEGKKLILSDDNWSILVSTEKYLAFRSYKSKSEHWDTMLAHLSDAIVGADVGFGKNLSISTHEMAARFIAAENRLSRGILSEALEHKINNVPIGIRSARLMFSPMFKDRLYVFLIISEVDEKTNEQIRELRRALSKAYGLVAKYQHADAKYVIVIATEPRGLGERSEDIAVFDYNHSLSIEERAEARRLEKKNILKFTAKNRYGETYSPPQTKIGRNDPCSCGSGKKFKKCCLSRAF